MSRSDVIWWTCNVRTFISRYYRFRLQSLYSLRRGRKYYEENCLRNLDILLIPHRSSVGTAFTEFLARAGLSCTGHIKIQRRSSNRVVPSHPFYDTWAYAGSIQRLNRKVFAKVYANRVRYQIGIRWNVAVISRFRKEWKTRSSRWRSKRITWIIVPPTYERRVFPMGHTCEQHYL